MAYLEYCLDDRILRVGKNGVTSRWLEFHGFLDLLFFLYTEKLPCTFVINAKDVWCNVRT